MTTAEFSSFSAWDDSLLKKRINRMRKEQGLKPFEDKPEGPKIITSKVERKHFEALEQINAAESLPELQDIVVDYLKTIPRELLICEDPYSPWDRQSKIFRTLGQMTESLVLEQALVVKQELAAG